MLVPGICGPNVTKQVKDAIAVAQSAFAGWTRDQQVDACEGLISILTGDGAWDIVELHNNAWILDYRPTCATQGANPPCGSTVQIGNECHYAGSANYVIWGVMCKLCFDMYDKWLSSMKKPSWYENDMLYQIVEKSRSEFTTRG